MSLAASTATGLRRCPACRGTKVTEISMTLTDGSPVDFVSCRSCEHKIWLQGDRTLPLGSVLTKAQKRR